MKSLSFYKIGNLFNYGQYRSKQFIILKGLILLLFLTFCPNLYSQDQYMRIERIFETYEQTNLNLSGVAFSPLANTFFVSTEPFSSEIILFNIHGDTDGSIRTNVPISDPINMAFDVNGNALLFFNDRTDELIEIKAGVDGRLNPSVGPVTRFQVNQFNLKKPQGMTLDPASGDLYFLDAQERHCPSLVRLQPQPTFALHVLQTAISYNLL